MTDTCVARRRSRTRPRSGVVVEPSWENTTSPSLGLAKRNHNKIATSGISTGDESHDTGSTAMSDEYGGSNALTSQTIPLEVVVITDDEDHIPSIRGHIVKEDVERRLQKFETLITSYRSKLDSSEHLNNSLHKYLRQTQNYAENLLSERQELLDIINEMEKEEIKKVDQDLLLKFMMCSSLFLYMFGGSHQFLVATVVLQLVVTFVNILI